MSYTIKFSPIIKSQLRYPIRTSFPTEKKAYNYILSRWGSAGIGTYMWIVKKRRDPKLNSYAHSVGSSIGKSLRRF